MRTGNGFGQGQRIGAGGTLWMKALERQLREDDQRAPLDGGLVDGAKAALDVLRLV